MFCSYSHPENCRFIKIHSALGFYSWARLWYYCRAIDSQGSGIAILSFTAVAKDLNCAASTLYQWLRAAVAVGAVRSYKRRGDCLKVCLGGLFAVCRSLGLKSWGAVVELELKEVITSLKQLSAAAALQDLQLKSAYQARRQLDKSSQQQFPTVDKLLLGIENASLKSARGATKLPLGVVYLGKSKLFVDRDFVLFGASQKSAARLIGKSDRTVARYLASLQVTKRQIVQFDPLYEEVQRAKSLGLKTLYWEGKAIDLSAVKYSRLFSYFGRVWSYGCSLYDLKEHLWSLKTLRRKYKRYLSRF